MQNIIDKAISINGLSKFYDNGFKALDNINLQVFRGEIFALLGPNGAGKTTLISIICGIIKFNIGCIKVFGYDNVKNYRIARSHIGLVPQELTTDTFETVWNTVSFSRGLFNKSPSPDYIELILKRLFLWSKKDSPILKLSGGMKRRVMIAKALSHEPDILFLDEPSSGVDVQLRQSMWEQIDELRSNGVSIILTTHNIAEAEKVADRVGVINNGKLILVEKKKTIMKKLGKKKLVITLSVPLSKIPKLLFRFNLKLENKGINLVFIYNTSREDNEIVLLLDHLKKNSIYFKDIETYKSSLEEIFVQLLKTS